MDQNSCAAQKAFHPDERSTQMMAGVLKFWLILSAAIIIDNLAPRRG